MHFMIHKNIFISVLKNLRCMKSSSLVPPHNFWDLRVRVPRSSFSPHKTATVTYLELTCSCTAAHKWHEFGDFSTVPGFAKNYCVIWHNARQIAVSLWGTTDGNWKSNSNNLSSTFGDLEWGMARVDEKPVCYKSLLASLLNLPHMHSSKRSEIADGNRGAWQCCVLGHD